MLLEEPVQNIRAKALGELFVQLDPGGDKILTSFKSFPLTDVFFSSFFWVMRSSRGEVIPITLAACSEKVSYSLKAKQPLLFALLRADKARPFCKAKYKLR